MLQSRVSEVLHVDIHPAAEVGRGILMVSFLKAILACIGMIHVSHPA